MTSRGQLLLQLAAEQEKRKNKAFKQTQIKHGEGITDNKPRHKMTEAIGK